MKLTTRKRTRRANNQGCITFGGKKKFNVSISTGEKYISKNGKTAYKKKFLGTFKTKKEAEEAIYLYNKETDIKINNKILLADYLDKYLKIKKRRIAETTFNSYINSSLHIKPILGNLYLNKIKSKDIDYFITVLSEKKLTNNSINKILTFLKGAFTYAIDNDYIFRDPCRKIKKLKPSPRLKEIPNHKELNDLLKEFTKEKTFKIPFLFCLLCGLRRGEALGVKWEDIDIERKIIKIKRQIVNDKGSIIEKTLKTINSNRIIPLPNFLINELEKIPQKEREGFIIKITKRKPNIFYYRFKKITEKIGLKNVCIHSLRHSYASILLNNSFSLDSTKRNLGHSSIKTTSDIYGHEIIDTNKEEIDLINKILNETMKQ